MDRLPAARVFGRRIAVAAICSVLLAVLMVFAASGLANAEPTPPTETPPTGWPLTGAARVVHPYDPPVLRWGSGHRGVDLGAHVGDQVLATGAGRVSYAGVLAGRGVVVVDHGAMRTTYEPVAATVAVGARVTAGQPVGRVTSGGHCGAAACLHWGLRRGQDYLDPLNGSRQGASEISEVRLLPASARGVAQRRAAARAAAARAAELALQLAGVPATDGTSFGGGGVGGGGVGGGPHGFLHPVPGAITSPFGRRFHPVLHVWKLHDGADFGAGCGTPIRAPYGGVVTRAFASPAYGHRLFLDHGNVGGRRVVTSYNHATRYVVSVGSRVGRGQVIGYVGATGFATGCHLHLMVWINGRLTNPASWL